MQETWVGSLGLEDPLEKEELGPKLAIMATMIYQGLGRFPNG